jgi:CO/xanthine dehydrogenase Mo-binding subunit
VTGKYFGKPIKRLEDKQLLTGNAKYIDDIEVPGQLHAAFLRSDFAHARILKIDVSEALKRPGVVAVYTAEDFGDFWKPGPLQVPPPTAIPGSKFNARTLVPIAKDKIRYSGEVLAVVIAESRYIAEDAFDDIIVDVESLPAVVDLEKAWEDSSVLVHDDLPSNMAALVTQEVGNYEEAKKKADVVVARRMLIEHVAGAAMENRGFLASWDDQNQVMTIWANTQSPLTVRGSVSRALGLAESQVHVITPAIGGGFGPKVMTSLTDDVLLPWISKQLKRPIKWVEDRRENFLATTSERDQVHHCEIALKKDGTILGFKDVFYHNTGAYDSYGMTVPLNTQTHIISNYRVPNFYTQIRMVFTNQMVVTPVRGAGRSEGVFAMERMLDFAAKEMGLSPIEIRRKNLLRADELPLATGITGQDFVKNTLDSGDYLGNFEKCLQAIEYDKFIKETQPKAQKEGKRLGIGVVAFTEGTAVGPYEGCKVTVSTSGKVTMTTGYSSQGQAHYTVFAQIIADQLNVKVEDVKVITGDTNHFAWGAGTFASRGATLVGTAALLASQKVRAKIFSTASKALGVPEDQVELGEGSVSIKGKPDSAIPLGTLAAMANPMRGVIEPGVEPGLEATAYYGPPHGSTGCGAMGVILSIDEETCKPVLEKMVIVDDCGTMINPLIVDGQLQGGISMGIGNTLYERLVYDENGQLLTASFMDYLMPLATDMPKKLEIIHNHAESSLKLNPLGIKGVGEAGAIPPGPAIVQAIEDAFADKGVEILETNLSPSSIYGYLKKVEHK